ncbi:hypothetical protein ACQP2X_39190 [Actinoplanes sp. CA-131856]
MRYDAVVAVSDHNLGIFDDFQIPITTADWSTGLAVAMSVGAMIYTGIDRGRVHVTVDLLDTAPEPVDTGSWDDIVEISITAPHGRLQVHQLEYGPTDDVPNLPVLSQHGPGVYRLRAHARNRDEHYDAVWDEPTEQYLLTLWPAPAQPNLIIRATDQCGYGLRLAALQTTVPDPTRRPPGEQEQRERDALQKAALLQTARQRPPT